MKIITITPMQEYFIRCAIELKDAVFPLHPESLTAKRFKEDYGFTKRELEKEIAELKSKL